MLKFTAIVTGTYLTLLSSASLAADEVLHDGLQHTEVGDKLAEGIHDAEHAPKGGLPQFDPEWFASQIFWLAICFAILYLIFAKKTLPDISSVIENRKNHIQSDLETAEKLTAEADEVQDAYQAGLNTAQNDASDAIKGVENISKAKTEDALTAFRTRSDETIAEAEANIIASKESAMDDMNQVAVDAAAAAVEKIIGVKPDSSKIQTIVKNMSGATKTARKTKAA